jgi:hypothetical protein
MHLTYSALAESVLSREEVIVARNRSDLIAEQECVEEKRDRGGA